MNVEPTFNQSDHLSDDALDNLLLGCSSTSSASHLASCEACAARLETFRSAMVFFNQASSAWSEAKSNSISRELAPLRPRFAMLPAWSFVVAFFFAVALSFLVGIHRGLSPGGASRTEFAKGETSQGVDREQEIASDNAMLHAIDSAISQPVPSPVEMYDIEKTNSTLPRRSAPREVRD